MFSKEKIDEKLAEFASRIRMNYRSRVVMSYEPSTPTM